jgi:cysteine desulfurase/selenocysteine lyase
MLEAVARAYAYDYSNVHRGVHTLSQRATAAYEGARETLARFLGAAEAAEIVFVRGTTEGLNLVAQSFARPRLAPGDEVLVSHMEHHSNIVPWQLVCEATGARLKVAPISDAGELDLDAFARLLGERTRIVALVHVSNALGTIVPVAEVVRLAHARGVPVVLDGAQAAPHLPLDVRELGCDFYTVSGHKLFGPTGIGVLYGRRELLEAMAPYQGGGEMISSVTFAKSEYKEPPHRFEAGTPNIVGAIGLGAVVDYLEAIGMERIAAYEGELLAYGRERLAAVPGLRLIGTARHKAALFSFVIEGVHAHDVGTILDQQGIAVRAGHHCAQPAMERFGIAATARASLAFYNTREEIDRLVDGLAEVREIFG